MKKLTINRLLLLSFFSLLFLTKAFGCQCFGRPAVLDEFEQSEDVFIGDVTGVEMGDPLMYRGGIKGARITVRKVYKGNLKIGEVVLFDQGGGSDCRQTYDEKSIGWKLLIYNSPYDGHRSIIVCGRTRGIDRANDDLRYLDNLAWTKGKTRISGEVSFGYFGELPEGQSIAGKKIKIIGKDKTFSATTDSTGLYEIYDVPPGQYLIEPEIPSGWKLNGYMLDRRFQGPNGGMTEALARYLDGKDLKPNQFPIDVQAGRHVGFDFQYEIYNVISGRLTGPDGKPMKGICIHAVPSDREESLFGTTDCTNTEGKFAISGLNGSAYILVINGDDQISGSTPIPKTFYPGVTDRTKATVIKIGPGVKSALGDFRVPKVLDFVVLSGSLFFADGKPVQTRKVQFVPDDPKYDRTSHVFYDYTESDGSFEIKILKGQSGRIRGEYYTGKKDLDLCPEWRKAIIEESSSVDWMITAATEWFEVKGDKDVRGIKFTFPFNDCDKDR